MDGPVAEPGDICPGDLRMGRFEVGGQMLHRLGDGLKSIQRGISDVSVREENLLAEPGRSPKRC